MFLSLIKGFFSLMLLEQLLFAAPPPKRVEVQKHLATAKTFVEIQDTLISYQEDARKWIKGEQGKLKEEQFSEFADLMMETEALSALQIWTLSPENCKSRVAYLKVHFSSATIPMTDVPESLKWIRESAERACKLPVRE